MSMLKRGERWIHSVEKTKLANPVSYYTASGVRHGIAATQGETTTEAETGAGIIVESKIVDWIIARDELLEEPRPGDFIVVHLDDGVKRYFEVAAVGGETAWRWHGTTASSYRIHSRETNEKSWAVRFSKG